MATHSTKNVTAVGLFFLKLRVKPVSDVGHLIRVYAM